MILLIAQGAITVTGSTVRVTGSGLGCDTWPNCHEGSLFPKPGAAPWIHQLIEFGNRTLTFVLVAIAVATLWAIYRAQRRRSLKMLAWVSIGGIVLQAVIGGVSVWLDLRWWAVALHFLPSEILVWVAAILYTRLGQPDDGTWRDTFSPVIRWLAVTGAVLLSVSLVTGTLVTAAGPHAGDASLTAADRLQLDIEMLAKIHAVSVYVFLFVVLAITVMAFRSKSPDAPKDNALILVGLIVLQAAIGLTQFKLGVPDFLVPIHVGVSSIVTAFTAFLWARGRVLEGGTATATGSPLTS